MDLSIPFLPLFEGIQEKGWKGRFPKFVSFQKKKNHFETKSIFSKKVNKKRLTWQKKKPFWREGHDTKFVSFQKKKTFLKQKMVFFFWKDTFCFKMVFFFCQVSLFLSAFKYYFWRNTRKPCVVSLPSKRFQKKIFMIYNLYIP